MADEGPRRVPSLLPREHGAYAQLAFPLTTGLALGRPGPAAILLVAAVIAAFLVHEPVLVVSGGRGTRLQQESGARASRRITTLGAAALIAGGVGLLLAPQAARVSTLVPAGLAVLLLPLIATHREKTVPGELLVAWTLSTTMIPVALATGAGLVEVVTASVVWGVASSLITITVRSVIARHKTRAAKTAMPMLAPGLCLLTVAAALVLATRSEVPTLVALAVVPTALVALGLGLVRVHPRHLKRVGWTFVGSSTAVLVLLLVGSA